ncbi:hypothetical protein Sru01_57160 [Sphaerisporangium rufum]|uniref:Protein kinase domain-containing protein n=1 Tax=Sphaerisporangium rufum TaxID=1381558 RepID=A0A919R760_9ACTN|nr:serine/threonine-protein kinase [Sphaerisporangium rufum]GII80734.1 hypothetical protein Sru01_57160 [Sphaerisporangium rufum]
MQPGRPSSATTAASVVWALAPLFTCGFATPFTIGYAAWRRRAPALAVAALLYLAGFVLSMVLVVVYESTDYPDWAAVLIVLCLFTCWIGGLIHSLAIRSAVFAPRPAAFGTAGPGGGFPRPSHPAGHPAPATPPGRYPGHPAAGPAGRPGYAVPATPPRYAGRSEPPGGRPGPGAAPVRRSAPPGGPAMPAAASARPGMPGMPGMPAGPGTPPRGPGRHSGPYDAPHDAPYDARAAMAAHAGPPAGPPAGPALGPHRTGPVSGGSVPPVQDRPGGAPAPQAYDTASRTGYPSPQDGSGRLDGRSARPPAAARHGGPAGRVPPTPTRLETRTPGDVPPAGTSPGRAPGPLPPGEPRQIGPYRLTGCLGQGGQGAVYLGETPDGARVAVKVLHARLAAESGARQRFLREVEAARRVAPFSTARVVDAGVADDRLFIVSEYVEGSSLEELVRERGPRGHDGLVRLALGTAGALAAIHRAGIVHRDFKPSNVLIGADGPRVVDFGIARVLDQATATSSGVMGTPAYMSPEQVAGERVGPGSDVFSWAATMVFAATGRPAFGDDNIAAVFNRIFTQRPDLSALPGPLARVVDRCLEKRPENRPSAADVMLAIVN